MKKITITTLALSLLATFTLSGCATTEGSSGGATARDNKEREVTTGTRVPGKY